MPDNKDIRKEDIPSKDKQPFFSPIQTKALNGIEHHMEGIKLREFAVELGVTWQKLLPVLKGLVKQGHLQQKDSFYFPKGVEITTQQVKDSDENLKAQIKDDKTPMSLVEQMVLLRAIDMFWVEHIDAMDSMRQGIGLSGYAQKDPLVEYKKESYRMFNELLVNIRRQVVYSIFKISQLISLSFNLTLTVSPTLLPNNAEPIGEFCEITLLRGSVSADPNIL